MSCCCLPTSLSVCVLCISLWRCLHTHLVPIRTAAASADVAASPASASAPASAARLGTRWYLELEQRSAHSTRRQRQPVSNNNNNSNMFVIASNNNNSISCCCCLRRCYCAATAAIGPGRQIMQSQRQEMFSASAAAAAAAIDRAAIALGVAQTGCRTHMQTDRHTHRQTGTLDTHTHTRLFLCTHGNCCQK